VFNSLEVIAWKLERLMVNVMLAWIQQKPEITATNIGFTRTELLEQTLSGLDLVLNEEMIKRLEVPYISHVPVGF
jgi:aryl-alcohol dehydrogenase-like predicted oxidoreductase